MIVEVDEHQHWNALEVKIDTSLWSRSIAGVVEDGTLVSEGSSNGDTSTVLDDTTKMDAVGSCLR